MAFTPTLPSVLLQDPTLLFNPNTVTSGTQFGAQALWDIFAARFGGDGRGCLGLVIMILITQAMGLLLWTMGTSRKVRGSRA